jgi:hypothetical protein
VRKIVKEWASEWDSENDNVNEIEIEIERERERERERLDYGITQGILKGEVSLYHWPPVWLVWNQLYDNWQFLCLFANRQIQSS